MLLFWLTQEWFSISRFELHNAINEINVNKLLSSHSHYNWLRTSLNENCLERKWRDLFAGRRRVPDCLCVCVCLICWQCFLQQFVQIGPHLFSSLSVQVERDCELIHWQVSQQVLCLTQNWELRIGTVIFEFSIRRRCAIDMPARQLTVDKLQIRIFRCSRLSVAF